jgi:hypothetical protein
VHAAGFSRVNKNVDEKWKPADIEGELSLALIKRSAVHT